MMVSDPFIFPSTCSREPEQAPDPKSSMSQGQAFSARRVVAQKSVRANHTLEGCQPSTSLTG